ncbi:hypothetical protein SAMN05443549_11419 [Flavobacterium fluvii]|uniref:Uncharacterized protein n=1 Tax=Flavobacterium fluvii TaxID=468056 RepID=A0A1M5PX85_9FLAO|nr:DUF6252 family protein [Flavobacterium fluvii]SHH06280.1 hypothetical protein SAMN05443549_11419 [Flavobacterium fluvii]
MRKFRFFILPLVIIATFCLNSCEEIEPLDPALIANSNINPGTTSGVFKVDFDGKSFVANTVQAIVNDNYIAISGLKTSSGELIQIALPAPYNKVGTYTWKNIGAAGIMVLAYIPSNGTEPYTADPKDTGGASDFSGYTDTASITISKIDVANKKISGTFQFTGVKFKDLAGTSIETKVFTNGSFTEIPFTDDNQVADTDTFYAKLDGTEFAENSIDVVSVSSSGVNPYYSIVGKKTNGDNIGISIAKSLSAGTYQFAGAFGPQVNASCLLGGVIYNGDTGSVTISSKTATHLIGTFNVVVKNFITGTTKTISSGAFSVELP